MFFPFEKWPYTNMHDLNLDWIIGKVRDLEDMVSTIKVESGVFVTPEQYGAAGDGITDDTNAVNAAINSGFPALLSGNYKITTINITNDNFYVIASKEIKCSKINISGSGGIFTFIKITTSGINIEGANNTINGGLIINDGTEYTSGINILANNTSVNITAINNFYIGISIGYSIISANGCRIYFNSMYGCKIGIQINAGVRNIFEFGTMANDGTGNGIYINPAETSAGENKFIFGSISGYDTGVLYNNSMWNAEGYLYIGSIFSCNTGFRIGNEGVHGYVTFIGTVDNIDIDNSIDVDDKSYKNNWIMPFVRLDKSDFSDSSRLVEMETGTMKFPVVSHPASGIKGELIFTDAGNIVFHDGTGFKTISSV